MTTAHSDDDYTAISRHPDDPLAGEKDRDTILRDVRAIIQRRGDADDRPLFTPAALMTELRISRNLAASLLEELDAAGELVKVTGNSVWTVPPAAQKIGRGYALPLSSKEAGALMRLLEERFATAWLVVICREGAADVTPFTDEGEARSFFDRASMQWSDSYLTQVKTGPRDHCGDLPKSAPGDVTTLREIRRRLKGGPL